MYRHSACIGSALHVLIFTIKGRHKRSPFGAIIGQADIIIVWFIIEKEKIYNPLMTVCYDNKPKIIAFTMVEPVFCVY